MHARGVISLVATVLLCLPSLTAAIAVVANVLLQRHIEEWGTVSSLVIAMAVFMVRPLLVTAAVVTWLVGMNRSVSQKVKYAHYIIVTLATIATFSVTFHFGM